MDKSAITMTADDDWWLERVTIDGEQRYPKRIRVGSFESPRLYVPERTCKNELSGQYDGACFKCSECSYECEVSVPHPYAPYSPQDTDWFCELPAHCPNCGTRVVEEDA